ncbi:MAG TPA: hypothetical protein VGM39_22460 [Kofleriaceae bacterium]|jgi:hypothetical protein
MRSAVLVLLAACGSAAVPVAPANSSSSTGAAPNVDVTKLGGLVLVPSVGKNSITYAPHADAFAFDTNKVAPTGSLWSLVGTDSTRLDVKAAALTSLPYGCDNNQLEGMPLVPTSAAARLPAGVAWMMPASATWKVQALPIARGTHNVVHETYTVGDMTLALERTEPSKGVAKLQNRGDVVELTTFQRVLMDGAEPSLATIDFSDPDMRLQIPVPVAAWALSPSGPYLIVLHTSGFEGASLETFLVEPRRATKIESMAVYLYQCAF